MQVSIGRQRVVRRIIENRVVRSQAELVNSLRGAGFEVTQATVSRDLRAVGAVKQQDSEGRLRYTIGPQQRPADGELRAALDDYALAVAAGGSLVVVHTTPGAAQVVAAAVDAAGLDGVVGTVAGDDTLLVVVAQGLHAGRIAGMLEQMGAGT